MTAATQRTRAPARRWRSLCLLGKAGTEAPMRGRINTGAPEAPMQRWGRCPETGEIAERHEVEFWAVGKRGGLFAELPVSDLERMRCFQLVPAALAKAVTSLLKQLGQHSCITSLRQTFMFFLPLFLLSLWKLWSKAPFGFHWWIKVDVGLDRNCVRLSWHKSQDPH